MFLDDGGFHHRCLRFLSFCGCVTELDTRRTDIRHSQYTQHTMAIRSLRVPYMRKVRGILKSLFVVTFIIQYTLRIVALRVRGCHLVCLVDACKDCIPRRATSGDLRSFK